MTLLIILGTFLVVLLFLSLTPLYLFISTPESRYEAGLKGILKVWVKTGEGELPQLFARILFFDRRIRLQLSKKDQPDQKRRKSLWERIRKIRFKRGRIVLNRKKIWLIVKLIWKVLLSFKLKQLKLNIDTGDVIRNAHLIPVFSMVYSRNIQLSINYNETNEFVLQIENNLGTIVLYIIKSYIKHHLKK